MPSAEYRFVSRMVMEERTEDQLIVSPELMKELQAAASAFLKKRGLPPLKEDDPIEHAYISSRGGMNYGYLKLIVREESLPRCLRGLAGVVPGSDYCKNNCEEPCRYNPRYPRYPEEKRATEEPTVQERRIEEIRNIQRGQIFHEGSAIIMHREDLMKIFAELSDLGQKAIESAIDKAAEAFRKVYRQ